MMKRILVGFTFGVVFLLSFAGSNFAQSVMPQPPSVECSCSSGTCSASVTCASGVAICSCSEQGCGAGCVADDPLSLDLPQNIHRSLMGRSGTEVETYLSEQFGKSVSFKPDHLDFRYEPKFAVVDNYWDIFDYLADEGELSFDTLSLAILRPLHDALTEGKRFILCSDGASIGGLLTHLSFLSGTKLEIVQGDINMNASGRLEGNGLGGLLQKFSENYAVTVVKN